MAMKKVIKTMLKIAGVILVLLLALLAYTFAPVKLDVAANQTPAPEGSRGRPDPAQLPKVTLSILKAGKMPARQAFAYRGGSWGGGYENGMAAILVRHPQAAFLIDAGFGANVDQHWRTIPWLIRQLSSYVKETPAAAQLQNNGIAPGRIKFAVITHSHWDTSAGWKIFPASKCECPW